MRDVLLSTSTLHPSDLDDVDLVSPTLYQSERDKKTSTAVFRTLFHGKSSSSSTADLQQVRSLL